MASRPSPREVRSWLNLARSIGYHGAMMHRLAAIAGMTALGGVIGYRQARAGYVLQAAGAGRFLQ
jgi:hypothetical protein